jgi:predicted dinucleotide-binding enzyme
MNYKKLLELGRPPGPGRLALPVAGDDARAKQVVMQLVNELGFDGVDDGDLDGSWRQQPGTPVYDEVLDNAGVRHALAESRKERLPQWRATGNSPSSLAQPA